MPMYGFQFKDGPVVPFAELVYVGWEERRENYDYHGLRRSHNDQCIFQYTQAGRGCLQMGGQSWRLEKGSAFLVRTGTDHRYFLPEDSPSWEFKFITLLGQEAEACWSYIQEQSGPVVVFAPESQVIRTLERVYQEAQAKTITNGYKSTSLAVQFLMDLYQTIKYKPMEPDMLPEAIVIAMRLMEERYREIDSIKELSSMAGMTPYKLSRLFHRSTGMTTVQYLTKIRMDKAMELLRRTELNLQEIAALTGYSSDNYFSKVFRKLTGLSPGQFRSGTETAQAVDHISFD